MLVEDLQALEPGDPGLGIAKQVLRRDHVEDRPDVLRHPAVDHHQALGQSLRQASRMRIEPPAAASSRSASGRFNRRCEGSSRPRLTPHSGSPGEAETPSISLMPGKMPPESCQPPPDPPSHSPRIARATTTFDSSGPSGPVRFGTWPVARIISVISEASKIGRDGQPRPLGNIVDLADDLQPQARA